MVAVASPRIVRRLALLLVVSTFCPALYGGFKPQQHIIVQSETNGPTSVYAADLDGDGDLDVLSASWDDDKIAWYANDGTGQFGPQQVITTAADSASCVYAADLDADGDLDVLSASCDDNKIAWYANDGTGQFGPQQVITTAADGANCVYAADLDGDGDLDVLSASSFYWEWGDGYIDDKIAWYANDGTGHFGPQQVITTEAHSANCVYAADLDGDGDLDVLSASQEDDKIAWYANDDSGQFGSQQVVSTSPANGADSVRAADLDGDGDTDVLSASQWDNKIAWYANDGTGHFGSQQVITTEADGASCVYVADLDGDGDLDVLSASFGDDKIAWYANDGRGQFGPQQVITTEADGAKSVYAADLDGDGDLDVLSASLGPYYDYKLGGFVDSKIAWYANDGRGQFGPMQAISTKGMWVTSVYAADLDGDGDLDVLSAFAGSY